MRLIIFTLFILCGFSTHAWQISQLRGDVQVRRGGNVSTATIQQELKIGDIIKTGKRARVLLVEGKSKLWLGQNTNFKLKSSEDKKSSILQILYGKMRTLVAPQQAKRYRYQFKTVVAGVRGTEFFAQTDGDGDRLCTLEGEVEVEGLEGERVLIPAGKGVLFSPGDQPQVSDNSDFLVDRWIAETSFESKETSIQDFYDNRTRKNPLGSNLYWGLKAWLTACDLWNPDYRNETRDMSQGCLSTYLSPFIQYGKKHSVFIRPAINTFWSNQATVMDDRPTTIGRQQETMMLAEGYLRSQLEAVDIKVGYQEIQWNEGVLISKRKWSPEPMTYLAFRSHMEINDWNFEFLAIDGQDKTYALDGVAQVSSYGVKVDLPKNWGNFFVLYADYPDFDSAFSRRMHHARELFNVGFYRKAKKRRLDYKVSFIYQKHDKLTRGANRIEDKGEGMFIDLEWGWTIPTKTPVRFSYRGLYASKDFAPMHNDYYLLGVSPIFRNPANMSQIRAKFEWQFATHHLFYLEYLNTEQIDRSGFVTHWNTTEDDVHLGDEIDFVYSGKISDSIHGSLGAFIFFPGSSLGPDPSSGLLGRIEHNF